MQELRCAFKKFGEVADDHTVEVRCNSKLHGYAPGTIVLHRFDSRTGQLISTKAYREIRRG